jgi:protein-disulfide isomerase
MPRGTPVHDPQTPEEQKSERWENIIAVSVVLLIVLAGYGAFAGWFSHRQGPTSINDQLFPVGIGDGEELGNQSAKVTIIEFSDFRCVACAAFHKDVFPRLKSEYIDTGIVRFVARDYPIEELHADATLAAIAARCANEQQRFWEFSDALYQIPGFLTFATLNQTAGRLGLDQQAFASCLASGRYDEQLRLSVLSGINEGAVSATPTFFINHKRIVGNQPYETFQKAIEDARKA